MNWERKVKDWVADLNEELLCELANELGVDDRSLRRLSAGWDCSEKAWTFPERAGDGSTIGIMRRYRDGRKRAVKSSKRGLYIADGWQDVPGPLFLPEGMSDTATLLSQGIAAIGRPSSQGGIEHLTRLLAETDREIYVLGDNDSKNGRSPGQEGAEAMALMLARQLRREVRRTLPPPEHKDVRAWANSQNHSNDVEE